MKARLFLLMDAVRASYWFIPALMLVFSAVLAIGLIALDQRVDTTDLTRAWWVFSGGAAGARSVLSTIASSVIGVAGTVFSITIAVLSLASSQFGSRLLRGFLRDQGNQFVLGTFVGTFLYCLLVLRSVRSVDESYFVPHLAVSGGMLLAVASIVVLLYFIHHVSVSIQSSHVIANAARELNDGIDRLFPIKGKQGSGATTSFPANGTKTGQAIEARRSGYVEAVDTHRLIQMARQHDGYLRLTIAPGDYVRMSSTIGTWQGAYTPEKLNTIVMLVNKALHVGNQRTAAQDCEFLFQQLTSIAVRALSAAVNDPYTALTCLDHLGEALGRLARCPLPSGMHHDDQGVLRLITPPVSFSHFLEVALGQIYHFGKTDPLVVARLQKTLDAVADAACSDEQRAAVAAFRAGCVFSPN